MSPAAPIAFGLFLSVSLSYPAAASTDFKVLVDTDHSTSTGCSVSGMPGIEDVVTTSVDTSGATPHVIAVTLQQCSSGVLGAATNVDTTGWPATFNTLTGVFTVETRIPFSIFGDPVPTGMRLGFVVTNATEAATIFTGQDGNPLLMPLMLVKRRSVNTPGHTFTLDGQIGDWGAIPPIVYGDANNGPNLLRFLAVFGAAGVDSFYFRFDAQSHSGAPTAQSDSYSTPVATPLNIAAPGVLSNDTDPNHLPLRAALVASVTRGALLLNSDGSFTYTPEGSKPLRDTFAYQASNGSQPSNIALVEINANDPPVANDDSYNVQLGGTLTIAAPGVLSNDTDADGDALHAILRTGPAHGTLTLHSDGSFTYVPDGHSSDDSFTYVANDGQGDSNEATVQINVTENADAPPQANDDRYTVDEGGTLSVAAPGPLGNDTDPDTPLHSLTMQIATSPAHATLSAHADGSFTYIHDGSETTSDSFTYRVSDGQAVSNLATVTITINPINDAPVAVNDTYSTLEDHALVVPAGTGVLANDTDTDSPHASLTAELATGPANGRLTLNADGSFTYTPNANFNGADSFTYRTSDGSLQSAPATVTITVTPVNDAPSFTRGVDELVLDTGGAQTFPAWATNESAGPPDEAGQLLSFIVSNDNNTLFSEQPSIAPNGTLSFTPAVGQSGVAYVTVQIHDNGGTARHGVDTSDPQTFVITIDEIPVITSANNATFALGAAGSFSVTTSGQPKPSTSITGTLPAGVTFVDGIDPNEGTGTLRGIPAPGTVGVYHITFTATNVHGSSAPQAFTLTVNQGPPVGHLVFKGSGCSCSPPPLPDVTVYVDQQEYTFPLFGQLSVPLSPGAHTWSFDAGGITSETVQIVSGKTVTVHIISNNGCDDGCDFDSSAMHSRSGGEVKMEGRAPGQSGFVAQTVSSGMKPRSSIVSIERIAPAISLARSLRSL